MLVHESPQILNRFFRSISSGGCPSCALFILFFVFCLGPTADYGIAARVLAWRPSSQKAIRLCESLNKPLVGSIYSWTPSTTPCQFSVTTVFLLWHKDLRGCHKYLDIRQSKSVWESLHVSSCENRVKKAFAGRKIHLLILYTQGLLGIERGAIIVEIDLLRVVGEPEYILLSHVAHMRIHHASVRIHKL